MLRFLCYVDSLCICLPYSSFLIFLQCRAVRELWEHLTTRMKSTSSSSLSTSFRATQVQKNFRAAVVSLSFRCGYGRWRTLSNEDDCNVDTSIVDELISIALCCRYMYWGQGGQKSCIFQAGLDGSHPRCIVDQYVVHPNGMTLGMNCQCPATDM